MIRLPLCDEQKCLFYDNEINASLPMTPSYTMRFSQEFSPQELSAAVDKCIRGADVFGARCVVKDDELYMEFLPYIKRKIPVLNFSTEEEFEDFCKQAKKEHINNRDKLYYIFIYSVGGSYYHIHFTINHLIIDAISILLLTEKIQRVLLGIEKEVTWHPFSAYLQKIQEYRESEKYLTDKEFWEEKFLGYSKIDYLFPEVIDIDEAPARELSFSINKEIKQRLLDYCEANNVSLHLLILAIMSNFINKKMGKRSFYFEVTIGNRLGVDEKNSLGPYEVGNLYSFDFSGDPDMAQLYESLREQRREYYKHQNYDYAIQPYYKEYSGKYGEFILQVLFSYFCTNKKPDFSIASIEADPSETEIPALTLDISDYGNWEEMTFDYIYWENCFSDVDVTKMHKEIEKGLVDIAKIDKKIDLT